jgi:hypothetical protein
MLTAQMANDRKDIHIDSASNISASMTELEGQSDDEIRRYISQQKQIIKKT